MTIKSTSSRMTRFARVMLLFAAVRSASATLDLIGASVISMEESVVSTSRSLKTFIVPFTADALEFVNYHKIDEDTGEGDCLLRAPVNAKYSHKEGCLSKCVVGWTEAGEWLEYEFESDKGGFVDIWARVSSKSQRLVSLYLDGDRITDGFTTLPGDGWKNFVDKTVLGVYIQGGVPHRLRVLFDEGKANLCGIAVFSFQQDDGCFLEADCGECIDKEGCSWVPELAKCMKEDACKLTGLSCWKIWYSKPLCDVDHCFRRESCVDCLFDETGECSWFYSVHRGLICRPAAQCNASVECFLPSDVLGIGKEFCVDLDDDTCATKTSCVDCLQTTSCGWIQRQQDDEDPGGCLPKSVCGLNCFTSDDASNTGTPADLCEKIDNAFERDTQSCGEASNCKDCYSKTTSLFDTCKWFISSVHEDSTVNFKEYCALECFEPWHYECEELPSFCPCAPDSSCTDCLSNGCGYWAEDEPKSFTTGRCHHFCRDDEYEWYPSDEKCFEFDEGFGLTASELCADHDACESHTSCKDCYAQKLPSNDARTCIWLRDRFCAPRCDTGYECDPNEDAFPQSCHCSRDTHCSECLGDGCGWDGDRCHLDCSGSREGCWTIDEFSDSDPAEFCGEYPCDPNPCKNGGGCIRTGVDSFECECPPDYRGPTCNLYLDRFEVPFTTSAIDFHQYQVQEEDDGLKGNCETGTRVDAKITHDTRCLSQVWNKICFVGWTQSSDWLKYKFHNGKNNTPVNIVVTIASARIDKIIRVSLEPASQLRQVFNAPGAGWNAFEEIVLATELSEGDYEIEVFFNDGDVNLCSVAVEERQS